MILEAILKLFFGIAKTLINLIPTVKLPDGFLDSMGDVAWLVSQMAYVLPVGTFLACMSVIIILQNARFVVSIFNFIIRKIPTIS